MTCPTVFICLLLHPVHGQLSKNVPICKEGKPENVIMDVLKLELLHIMVHHRDVAE